MWRALAKQTSFLALVLAPLSVFAVWPVRSTSPCWGLVPLSLLLVGIGLATFGWRATDIRRNVRANDSIGAYDLEEFLIQDRELTASAELLWHPARYTHRIIHEVSPGDDYLMNVIVREMTLPRATDSEEPHTYYIPLLYPERGVLLDDLGVESEDVDRVRIVPSSLAHTLMYDMLVFLTEDRFNPHADPERTRSLREKFIALVPVLLSDMSVDHEPGEPPQARDALRELARMPPPQPASPSWAVEAESVVHLWEAAFTSYIIFGEVTAAPGAPLSLKVSYAKPVSASERIDAEQHDRLHPRAWAWRDHLRAFFGVRPYVYRFPLQYERATASYHVRFVAPTDQYVSQTEIRRSTLLSRKDEKPTLVVARSDDSSTMHYVHLNLRPLGDVTSVGELRMRLGLRERPPGLLGLVALIGVIQLVMYALTLGWYDHLFSSDAAPAADVPTLLLAIPALISAWMANQIGPGRLRRMPLTAVLGIAYNGLSALVATSLALLASRGIEVHVLPLGRIDVVHPLWFALLIASVFVTGNVVLRWMQSTYIFVGRLRRGPSLERYLV
jgi:hypothetical protein